MDTGKNRIIGLDIFRVCMTFLVFLFHTRMHAGCHYGKMDAFIGMGGGVAMTGFYLLSGYTLYITYQSKRLMEIDELKNYYQKRIISIFPLYYFAALIYVVFISSEGIADNILLAPIEILGLQSTFSGLFSVSHNGGTWFISCLIICYVFYPFLQEVIKQISCKIKGTLMFICIFVLLWTPFVVYRFSTSSIYANPFFRGLEFFIGAILASISVNLKNNKYFSILFCWKSFFAESMILIMGISTAVKMNIGINNYMLYSWIALPIFILMMITLGGIESKKLANSKVLRYLSTISYAFFLAQFFTWRTANWIIEHIGTKGNVERIVITFSTCLVFAILLHELIEKKASQYCRRHWI